MNPPLSNKNRLSLSQRCWVSVSFPYPFFLSLQEQPIGPLIIQSSHLCACHTFSILKQGYGRGTRFHDTPTISNWPTSVLFASESSSAI